MCGRREIPWVVLSNTPKETNNLDPGWPRSSLFWEHDWVGWSTPLLVGGGETENCPRGESKEGKCHVPKGENGEKVTLNDSFKFGTPCAPLSQCIPIRVPRPAVQWCQLPLGREGTLPSANMEPNGRSCFSGKWSSRTQQSGSV